MRLISVNFFAFLIITLVLYYLMPREKRWAVLALQSLVFYFFAGIYAFIYILMISLSSYFFARSMQREGSKFAVGAYLSVIFVSALWLSALLASRFFDIMRPLGISFYSLRVISYLLDVRHRKTDAEGNFLKYLLFVCYFPAVLQGPVTRYCELSERLCCGKGADIEGFSAGIIRIMWGIFKKAVIADALAVPLAMIYTQPESYSGAYTLFLLIFYSAEIYCDFSGGIDIALGVSRLFGIGLPENFDRPFASSSVREFWNRWHITLGEFFEHYVFYPISFSKPMQRLSKYGRKKFGVQVGKKLPVYTATMLTWLCTGLWHGVRLNFTVWGIINGVLVLISQSFAAFKERHGKIAASGKGLKAAMCVAWGRTRVFLIIGAVRLLDVYGSVGLTFLSLGSVFYELESYVHFFSGGIFSLMPLSALTTVLISLILLFAVSEMRISSERLAQSPFRSVLCVFSLLTVILLFGSYGAGFDVNDFIYSRY